MNNEFTKLNVEFTYLPVINFSMQQNKVPIIRFFSIKNLTDNDLQNLKITLTTNPDFATSSSVIISSLPPNEIISVDTLNLLMNYTFFSQLTEKINGNFNLEILEGDVSIYKNTYSIDVLAFDQWSGVSILPEMLSAFITPNHPSISPIINRASEILNKWTGNPSMDEYQSCNPNRVRSQIAAIYSALAELSVIYCTAPSSFEEYGQRIRLCDSVLNNKYGTCLDMALLFASCIEAIGIHPLIIIMQGHAFAGGWLIGETFPDVINDDISLLSKRIADGINEIVLVECTCMNAGQNIEFDNAVQLANRKLLATDQFTLFIDVKRSRFSGIRPLPQRALKDNNWVLNGTDENNTEQNPIMPTSIHRYDLNTTNAEIKITKQLLWERKLLDLSLRNNLLNIRINKNTLQLISTDVDKLEDSLADGEEFQILPKPNDWSNSLYDFGIYHSIHPSEPIIDLIKHEITHKRLRSYLSDLELNKSLIHLYRSSRLSLEENGANTLYLALGLLKWYESPNSERPRFAPILLLPVEIIRKSSLKGYVIRTREEETMMNITLLEMLRQNFGITISGLDPLPKDNSGSDVKLIFSMIRKGIMGQKKWDVEEQAILGTFSFNKFIMWNDIHNNAEKLCENKVVASLMSGKVEWEVNDEMADAIELDHKLTPADIALPISADSSQLEAINDAANNKSFILHGPPGTGKSQTITNIIANALYKGKRVLFVAEKMAALSVVQKRLESIGLAPFCLELHSNKTKKTSILSQLKETSEIVKYISPENFEEESNRLFELRSQLNGYVESLHRKYSFSLSLYESIIGYLSIDTEQEFEISHDLISTLTKPILKSWKEDVSELVTIGRICGHPYQHPLLEMEISDFSSQIKDEIVVNLNAIIYTFSSIIGIREKINNLFGINCTKERDQLDLLEKIITNIINIPNLSSSLLSLSENEENIEDINRIIESGEKRDLLKSKILASYTKEILAIPAQSLLLEWKTAENNWLLFRFFKQKTIIKKLSSYSITGELQKDNIVNTLQYIVSYNEEKEKIEKCNYNLPVLFGKYGKKESEDWKTIKSILDNALALNQLLVLISKNTLQVKVIRESLFKQLSEGLNIFIQLHKSTLTEYLENMKQLKCLEELLKKSIQVDLHKIDTKDDDWLNCCSLKCKLWLTNIDKLKDWYRWLQISSKLKELNIGFVADDYLKKNIPTEKIYDIFTKGVYHACAEFIISKESSLQLFNGKFFNENITSFREINGRYQMLIQKELYAKLASSVPSFTKEASLNSEVGILQKNIRSNGRGTSIRTLFDSIPTLLSRMCPCMLMSPMSVAQYIDPNNDKFDLVVFDEASQMPTCEAIGAIARGKNVIVVGDPKQMPPTSFFSNNTIDEDNLDLEDLESILDDCLALSIPSKYLLWHYRSKHESLIAFSNSQYYDNKLLTFPSPDDLTTKVSFVPVQGFYDKGNSKQNKAEAKAIIDEIAIRLSDKELRKKSIGVVTFSSVQQGLIDDMLSELFVLKPELESLALDSPEPLFIKNLENVQGDERDIILFSIGYGPDINGKISLNFGPLNREGGERRLNVAVSRARYEMKVFSTLQADQIDLKRTSSIGVAGLKNFLEYAEKGKNAIAKKQFNSSDDASIANLIADKLKEEGYQVHTNIGCSGFKIDIGVVNPQNPSKYTLGILCDGKNYKLAKTARDREIVQNSVLKMLGWNTCRVWSLDWWEKPEEVIKYIIDNIKQALDNNIFMNNHSDLINNKPESSSIELKEQPKIVENVKAEYEKDYPLTTIPVFGYSYEDFLYPLQRSNILKQIEMVIQNESPISRQLLCKKVLEAWNISRMGQRIDSYFDSLLEDISSYKTTSGNLTFFWNSKEDQNSYNYYRPNSTRDAVDLPPEEVANGIHFILKQQISLPIQDIIKISAQLFGFSRVGNNVETSMRRGIETAIARGYAKTEENKIKII
jgi:superfamily I DNA and/or RNA helicase